MTLGYNEMEKRSLLVEVHQKEKADLCCPKCGEKHWLHLNKKDKAKGIEAYEKNIIEKQNVFKSKRRIYLCFHCYTCGFVWYTKRM